MRYPLKSSAAGTTCVVLWLGAIPSAAPAGKNRPQTPTPPFPYVTKDVTFTSQDGSATLAGTLTLPRTGGPFPAAYLIPGAAPSDRDETFAGHKMFLVLADHLTRKGFAVLRADDRGVGKSTGSKFAASFDDLALDAVAGMSFLKAQPGIDPKRVGVIGHSLGAVLAPVTAARSDDVSFVIMMAGTGESWMDYLAARAAEDGEGTVDVNRKLAAIMNKMLRADNPKPIRMNDVREEWEALVQTLPADEQGHAREFMNGHTLTGLGLFLGARPLREMLAYDPATTFPKVHCPVLAITGDRDPMAITLPSIEAALKDGGNEAHSVLTLPHLNHMFQTVKTENYEEGPAQWAQSKETISPVALEAMSTWLTDRFVDK